MVYTHTHTHTHTHTPVLLRGRLHGGWGRRIVLVSAQGRDSRRHHAAYVPLFQCLYVSIRQRTSAYVRDVTRVVAMLHTRLYLSAYLRTYETHALKEAVRPHTLVAQGRIH